MNFKEAIYIVETMNEGVSRSQKDYGQRVMSGIQADPIKNLYNWFNEEWKNKPKNKNYFIQRKRILELKEYMEKAKVLSDKEAQDYLKSIVNDIPTLNVKSGEVNKTTEDNKKKPYLYINTKERVGDDYSFANGFGFKINGDKFIQSCIKRFIILHEYGHVFEFFKDYVLHGKAKIIDTFSNDYKNVRKSEGKANDYAIKNSYRKDILSLLIRSDIYRDDALNFVNSGLERVDQRVYDAINNYRKGTVEHSDGLKEKLKTINKIRGR